jgi:aryl-alcohol dehydrogenase-like predicted oxidoreductase
MEYRRFGNTDLLISEYGFGAWGIGGQSYGPVNKSDALDALSTAQEYGCNFIDTAQIYGNSEAIIGEFLKDRRDQWILSTKYSGQKDGLTRTLDKQLKTLKTEYIDFYQAHWMPAQHDPLFRELEQIKNDGKARFVGVSLYNKNDIKSALNTPQVDGFQVACNLLEPYPYINNLELIKKHSKGVLIRSSLKSGLLSGKYNSQSKFKDSLDLRLKLTTQEMKKIFALIEKFNFLVETNESLLHAAARYPLAFKATSCVLLGTKNGAQARVNFHEIPGKQLTDADLGKIEKLQKKLGVFNPYTLRYILSRLKSKITRS